MIDLTAEETVMLILLWGKLAPNEPNNFIWSCRWQRWEAEHGFLPKDFLEPDSEEDEEWEYAEYKQEQNERYDRLHTR